MNYAIELLLKERHLVENAISPYEAEHYPEAVRLQRKRLNELNQAINRLQDDKHILRKQGSIDK